MTEFHEVKINDCSIYFEDLEQVSRPGSVHDSIHVRDKASHWSDDMLKQAATPLVEILDVLRKEMCRMDPDEAELSMQLELAVNGETPVFKVVSLGSKSQISVKFVWKSK